MEPTARAKNAIQEVIRMHLEMKEIALPIQAEVRIDLSLTAQVNITDVVAQRKVSKLLLDEVGNLLYGERPSLVVERRLLWHVPIWLGSPTHGPIGQVGTLDVDTQSGEILFTQEILDEIAERGNALEACRVSSLSAPANCLIGR